MMITVVSMIFIFQAEDGIRDYKVTGVQTCALPIFSEAREVLEEPLRADKGIDQHGVFPDDHSLLIHPGAFHRGHGCGAAIDFRKQSDRSEERRVGKECRSRWSSYH